MMAVGWATIKLNLGVQEETALHLRATEAKESLGITIWYLIRPVASIGLRIEGQTLRTIKHVTPTVHAIHKLTAMLMIADLEVTVLMRTIVGRSCRLQIWPARAVYVDGISARIIEACFRVEKQALGTQFFFGNSIDALDVTVALIVHRVTAVPLRTRCGRATFRRILLLNAIQLIVK